jgi:N-acetylglucosaminyl-diphospho-decaprenol L-rhamnosyltransferase
MSSIKSMIPESLRAKYRYLRARLLSIGLDGDPNHPMSIDEKRASAAISVIVPIHDAPEVTERCLRSLERNGGDAEVILIDDGSRLVSTRQVVEQAVARNGWVAKRWETASGHSRACERGATMAQRSYLCFLNSDTVVTPFSWAGMVKVLQDGPGVGVVGPSTSEASTRQVVRRARRCRLYWTDGQIDEFAFRYTSRHQKSAAVEMDYVGGFGFIVTRSAWAESGGFDQRLPAFGNEVDLCRRLKKQGFRCLWTKASYIHHFGESSFLQHFTSEELHLQRVVASRYIDNKSG